MVVLGVRTALKAFIWSVRFRQSLALPIMASTVTVIAVLISQTMQEPVDALPPDSVAEVHTTGNAAIGGRPLQVCLSLVRRVVPPAPAVDVRYNWPPMSGVTLRIRVGVIAEDGRPRVDPAAGHASARTGITSADGIILVDYIPPQRTETAIGAAGSPVALWFEDRDSRAIATEIRLWNREPIGAKRPPRLSGAPPQPERWTVANLIQGEPFAGYFDRAVDSWGQTLAKHGGTRFQSVLSRETSRPQQANLTAAAGYPTRPDERVRSSFAVTEISRTGRARIGLHLEYLNPDRRFRPFVPGAVTGLENIGRSFEPTLPLDAVLGTMTHELGHVLGLDDTVDPEAQASVMNQGRGRLLGNNFRFFVNEIFAPTSYDALAAIDIRSNGTQSLATLGDAALGLPAGTQPMLSDGAAVQPPMSTGVRYHRGASLFRTITAAAAGAVRTTAPAGAPPWVGTAWNSGEALEFSVWPELDLVRFDEGPNAGEVFRTPGVGRMVLKSPDAGKILVRNPTLTRRLMLDVPMRPTHVSLASLRLDAERATYGAVAGFLQPERGRSPILLVKVLRSLWQPGTHRSNFLRIRWPAGSNDYSGLDFPSPSLHDPLILFTCREIGTNPAGGTQESDVEQISMPLPFGAIGIRDGATIPLGWLGRARADIRNSYLIGSFRRAPKIRQELFGANLPDLLNKLARWGEPVTASRMQPTQAGLRLPLGL